MADFENTLMAQPIGEGKAPEFPTARDFEDQEVHIKRHNLFRKSLEYRALPPAQQKAVDQHVEGHQMILMQQVQAQMAITQSEKGAPGEKGAPSASGPGNKKPEGEKDKAQDNEASKPGGGESAAA
jgi:hypothetical protein